MHDNKVDGRGHGDGLSRAERVLITFGRRVCKLGWPKGGIMKKIGSSVACVHSEAAPDGMMNDTTTAYCLWGLPRPVWLHSTVGREEHTVYR